MSEERILAILWGEEGVILDEITSPEKETRVKYNDNDVILLVIIKNPGEIPRIMPATIENPALFLSDSFGATWADIGDKVRAEISRVAVR